MINRNSYILKWLDSLVDNKSTCSHIFLWHPVGRVKPYNISPCSLNFTHICSGRKWYGVQAMWYFPYRSSSCSGITHKLQIFLGISCLETKKALLGKCLYIIHGLFWEFRNFFTRPSTWVVVRSVIVWVVKMTRMMVTLIRPFATTLH